MGKILENAFAKINLTLKVVGRRADGYHEIDSLVVFADAGDVVWVNEGDVLPLDETASTSHVPAYYSLDHFNDVELAVSGAYGGAIEGENLVESVAKAFMAAVPQEAGGLAGFTGNGDGGALEPAHSLQVGLEKVLPVAAGLGGGSADAAALIRLFQRLGFVDLDDRQIADFGKRFGADVPVCVYSQPAFMRGIGEVIEPLEQLPSMGVLLVNPRVSVPTGSVFAALNAAPLLDADLDDHLSCEQKSASGLVQGGQDVIEFFTIDDVVSYMERVPNDLSAPALGVAPVIGDVLQAIEGLPGCRIGRLSGSGATCFGLFENMEAARLAGLELTERFPEWWILPSVIRGK